MIVITTKVAYLSELDSIVGIQTRQANIWNSLLTFGGYVKDAVTDSLRLHI